MMSFYRLLLRLYPAAFRAEYGDQLLADFEARRRETSILVLWIEALIDILTTSLQVHLDLLRQDLRWSLRTLRQSPGFTFTSILVIALGIGASTASFTLLDYVLLRPLPFSEPDRLVKLYHDDTLNGYPRLELSPANFLDWRAAAKSFDYFGVYQGRSVNLSGQGEPRRIDGAGFTADILPALRVAPVIGRPFNRDDERPGAPGTVLISQQLWKSMFGADPGVLGRKLLLDDEPYVIIGVMPDGFYFPERATLLWTAIRFHDADMDRTNNYLHGIARLRDGVSVEQARAEMKGIAAQLARAYPKENANISAAVIPLRDVVSTQSRMIVLAVFGAAICVMLIASLNQASLLLARGLSRRREIAVRIAIGAGRERLLRQMLTENLTLSAIGGAVGLMIAWLLTPALALLVPAALPVGSEPRMNLWVFLFAALMTLVTAIVFGAAPALRTCGQAENEALRERSGGGLSARFRMALVVAEVAGTVVLLVGAGLLTKALFQVQAVNPGFTAEGVMTLRTVLPMPRYEKVADRQAYYTRVIEKAEALPGVESASYISFLPMVMRGGIWPVEVAGYTGDPNAQRVSMRFVTPKFFSTMRIPLLRGRDFTLDDHRAAPFGLIVSESFAKRYFPGQDPIGRSVRVVFFDRRIVGVVADIAVRGLERTSEPQVYLSAQQIPDRATPWYAPKDLVVRTKGDPRALAPALRAIIREADPDLPVSSVQSLADIVEDETSTRRAQLVMIGVFTALAFLLAAVGVHGLLAFAVSARTSEMAVRLAVGAQRRQIVWLFVRQGLVMGAAGVVLAIPVALMAGFSMQALLFAVKPTDLLVFSCAAALALVMTLAGTLIPAWRAAGVDPAVALRS